MSVLIRYSPRQLTQEQYQKVNETMMAKGEPPPAELKIHVMFEDADGNLLVSEVWESEEIWRQSLENVLGPALREAGVDMGDPQVLPVHALWGSSIPAE